MANQKEFFGRKVSKVMKPFSKQNGFTYSHSIKNILELHSSSVCFKLQDEMGELEPELY